MGKRIRHGLLLLTLLAFASSGAAQPPPFVSYQGLLLDVAGAPLQGRVILTTRLFDGPSLDASLLYEEEHGVRVVDGVFSVPIGNGSTLQGTFDAALFAELNPWLEVAVEVPVLGEVGRPETLAPRQSFGSVGYAFQSGFSQTATFAQMAGDAATLGGTAVTGLASVGHTHIFAGIVGEISSAQIPDLITRDAELAVETAARMSQDTTLQNQVTSHEIEITALMVENSQLSSALVALQTTVDSLTTLLAGVQRIGDILRFSGMNVQVVNGVNQTNPNGLGNLIVGYNTGASFRVQTGSHNLVVGTGHTFTSYGGLVAGRNNSLFGAESSITGGFGNSTGISGDITKGSNATVSGGEDNVASGRHSSVSGGRGNTASGPHSSVSGGTGGDANGSNSSVSGGFSNTASGGSSSVSGGTDNTASGGSSSVSGGLLNTASGNNSGVSGGFQHDATGAQDWRAGTLFEDF